jgi:hypothetical protein
LQCPKSTLPSLGKKCGRRERETEREDSFLADRNGERHPGFREAIALRGAWRNADLGRSGSFEKGLSLHERTRRRQRMSLGRRGGERRQRGTKGHAPLERQSSAHSNPGHVLRSVQGPVLVESPRKRGRTTKTKTIAVGQTRANGRNRHRGIGHRTKRGSPRASSLRASGEESGAKEKDGGRGLPPCEETGIPDEVPARRNAVCRSRSGGVWPRISTRKAPSKRVRRASERRPSSE